MVTSLGLTSHKHSILNWRLRFATCIFKETSRYRELIDATLFISQRPMLRTQQRLPNGAHDLELWPCYIGANIEWIRMIGSKPRSRHDQNNEWSMWAWPFWPTKHLPLMVCICATYEAYLPNKHGAMEQSGTKFRTPHVIWSLIVWAGNCAQHIIPSWFACVSHLRQSY